MRHSDFWRLVDDEFGAGYGRTLVRDHVLGDLGHRTGEQALAAGEAPRTVWLALCRELNVPAARWLGRDDTVSGVTPAAGSSPRRRRAR